MNQLNISGFLLKRLIIPLLLLASIFIIISFFIINQSFKITWQELFLNLGVTFLGIIITVSYVNWILNEHENKRWNDVHINIDNRIRGFLVGTITTFREGFGIGIEAFSDDFNNSIDLFDTNTGVSTVTCKEIINIGENILIPSISSSITNLNRREWLDFMKKIQLLQETLIRLVDLFSNKIEPNTFSKLLKIEDEIAEVLRIYTLLSDYYGVPDENIPPNALKYKPDIYRKMKVHMENIISLDVELMKKMTKRL